MKYNVHVYRTVRMKIHDIEAQGPIEAMGKADAAEALSIIRHQVDQVDDAEVMDDEGDTYYLVDPLKNNGEFDEDSRDYNYYGPAPFYPKNCVGAQSLIEDLLKDKKNWTRLKGMHPYLDQLLLEYKLNGGHPLDEDEFRKLPTLLHKDSWLDVKIKGRLTKGE